MSAPVVFADADVLYKAVLRDLLMELGVRRAIRLHWSDQVQDEWTRALLTNRSDITADQLLRTRNYMDMALPNGRVTDYAHLIEKLALSDPNDRHVLAAAIVAEASVILTFNTSDFVSTGDTEQSVPIAVHPDNFLPLVATAAPSVMTAAVQQILLRTRRVSVDHVDFLSALERADLPKTAQRVGQLLLTRT